MVWSAKVSLQGLTVPFNDGLLVYLFLSYNPFLQCLGRLSKMTLERFEFNDLIKDHFMLLIKQSTSSLPISENGQGYVILIPCKHLYSYICAYHTCPDPSLVFDVLNIDASYRWYKYASMGFTLVGAYLLAKHAFQYIMERRRHWELRKRYCFTGFFHYHCCLHPFARNTRKCILFIKSN